MRLTILLLTAVLGVVVGLIYLLKYLKRRSYARDFRINDRLAWQKRWQELEAMLAGGSSQWAVAVIEADKLFDRVTRSMALPGKDFGERLRFLSLSRPEIRAVWPAHLIRNRLVHEAHYELDRRTAISVLKTFERALKDLGIL
ncbi:hypothetical protein A3H10_04180 [Candidatus Uhrbacteria bacterium RIFCSPLOWO2_12_FULL_46_10]|uniref:DUF4145 domain-containing protein n=1 Tax=Candidatus Uhrbacteria bacterium RIFCSPLOWO2_01_FULL_47_25 TaxID=1802402 RepID=A0A1F7UX35_9BACT|nr:MAG: hypothetical protein UX68_C0001G0027 [Parcubacteria group bacterium GW2011_GWA2_46_9]OGL60766.1 MAG: hypothetical protein A2752_03445 [Candidatus Uhrbacteria bacterium RIFCSPHIGHO2_01_FULL_46_23]OGL70068.1 MAG: hypothetical protein A3D60_03320 [Candidatus Uhrbacteria bacterium RIFCSPHIGHO2_02_FULL_47_29]OGL75982.1 MAG: hypothetical protein A3E96_01985 [Candidatus Uhrbacteria bacterium RIFCSPHIGHO2_12_FULL_46_13]OGL82829.1 MAG: hypothetical protein A2936_04145 [Candidatus Uhrbacteria bac